MTRTRTFITAIPALTFAFALAACSGDETPDGGTVDSGVADTGVIATLTAISVAPETLTLAALETAQLTVTGTYDDGSTSELTSGVVYDSSDDSVALVDSYGKITALADGNATISVVVGEFSAEVALTVGVEAPDELVVFDDDFADGVSVEDFGGATNVLGPDTAEAQAGDASLKIEVPATGYTGGALAAEAGQDLSSYDALVFWAKASAEHTIDVTGLGNDATTSTYQAEYKLVSVGTSWARYVVPIPDPSKLTSVQGLFHFAEGGDEGAYTLWLDDIKFVTLGSELSNFRPAISSATLSLGVGQTANVEGPTLVVAVNNADQTIEPTLAYFTFASSDETVATVDATGRITARGEGTATITASLGGTPASGEVTVTVGPPPDSYVVFDDAYPTGVTFEPFGGSTNDVSIDGTEAHGGTSSLKILVPATNYTGGALKIDTPQDLRAYDAVTFWAKADSDFILNVAGLGDDANTNTFQAEYRAIQLSGTWTRFVVPIPDQTKLDAVQGLFHFAEGSEDGSYTIWLDDIQYETLGTITNPRPEFATETLSRAVGETFGARDTRATFSVDGTDQLIYTARAYFDWTSSNPSVASVDALGVGTALAVGSADLTATLQGVAAVGTLTVDVNDASAPATAAPTPTQAAADVVSLFSNAYTDIAVDTWSASWDQADVADIQIAGDDVKHYTNLVFAGVEFTTTPVDATSMTHFHMDIWSPSGTNFRVKLVDFGGDGSFGGGDDTEHELTFDSASTPAFTTGQWVQLDIPLSAFANMTGRSAIAQLVIGSDGTQVYIDNVYFHGGGGTGPTAPTAAAPTPTEAAADVISLFSNAYTNVTVDTWSAVWDSADVADIQVAGDDVKHYTNFTLAGIEATTTPVDATAMTHFHMDYWAPAGSVLRIKLVDFGGDGSFGGGDDTEHELTFDAASTPAFATGQWVSLDIPLADFTGMTGRSAIAQYILSGDTTDLYIDNVYFHGGGGTGPTAPTAAAPTPTEAAADVISLFSNAYTNVTVDTWSAVWDSADVADIQIAGDDVKHYTNFTLAGIEATTTPVDASAMTHFRMDYWAPAGSVLRVKLVDFGGDGSFGGGDDTEHELTFDAASTPALATGQWVSLDIPLADFTGMTGRSAIAQYILSGDTTDLYVDNVYFYDNGGSTGPTAPTAGPVAPTQLAADVISLFSDAYTDVLVDSWSTTWDDADVADVQIAGDNLKHYTNFVFAGVETSSVPVDATSMTHFHVDMWAPSGTVFRVKLVDWGADGSFGGGDDTEHELTFDAASTPGFTPGQWISLDLPLSDFVNMTGRSAIAQYIFSGDMPEVYIDNVYFYDDGTPPPTAPTVAAPAPTPAASSVISLFSGAYTDVLVDTWSTTWDNADVADVQIAGDDVKHYTNFVFAGVETSSVPVDASTMTHFHVDIWAPSGSVFRVKLVDWGADGSFGGGDDTEHELTFDAASTPMFATGQWVSLDLPLSDFVNMTGRTAVAQYIFSGDVPEVYVDNVFFYDGGSAGPTAPTFAAPTPTVPAADVISLFSNAYTDIAVDTWSTTWDNADVADVQVAGDDAKHYTNFVLAGIETGMSPVDATQMTHFHMDVWVPSGTFFRIKLVDYGPNGVWNGGPDDAEHELTFDAASTPALVTGQWMSLDIPLSDFTNMTTRAAVAQYILSGDTPEVYIDNVYFHR